MAILASLDTGKVQIGSGYLLSNNTVLTAHHCTIDKRTGRPASALQVVRRSDGAAIAARPFLAVLDAAVLIVDADPSWAASAMLYPPSFGRVDATHSGEMTGCEAVGFPLWQLDPAEKARNAAELHGTIRATEGSETGVLVVRDPLLADVAVPASVAKQDRELESAWGGLSGALVFYGGMALGIIVEHHPRQGRAALTVLPVERIAALARDGDRDAAEMATALGLPRDLPVVTPSAASPAGRSEPAEFPEIAADYARWLMKVHGELHGQIAGRMVTADTARAPVPDRFWVDETGIFERESEAEYLALQAPADTVLGEQRAIARFPAPTHLGPARHPDMVDMAGKQTIGLDGLLTVSWRSVIAGDPGSGKSTLVRVVARTAAAGFLDDQDTARLPVLFRAAEFDSTLTRLTAAHPDRGILLEHVAIAAGWDGDRPADLASLDPLPATELMTLADRAFAAGQLFLIIDGLDEAPDLEHRRRLVALLRDFADRAGPRKGTPGSEPGVQLLVTTRFTGYQAAPLDQRFTPYMIAPLTEPVGRAVTEYWADAAGSVHEGVRAALGRAFGDLRREAGGRLAGNPFLLVSLVSAVLAGQRSGGRSWTRSDLYRAILDDAVRRCRDRCRDAPMERLAGFQCAFAYLFHQDSRTGLIAVGDPALDEMAVLAARNAGVDPMPSASRLKAWLEAMGLLAERGQGVMGFMHLSIEEYLAGAWLTRDPPSLAEAIARDDPRWAEPVRLGIADLSCTSARAFGATLDYLLTAGVAVPLAAVLSTRLDELAELNGAQAGRLLAAVLGDAIPSRDTDAIDAAQTLDGVVAMADTTIAGLLRASSDYASERQQAVTSLLIRLLREGSGADKDDEFAVALAARLTERLRLFDAIVAAALLTAQSRETGGYGWHTVRALQAMASADNETVVEDREAAVTAAVGRLTEEQLKVLHQVSLRLPGMPANTGDDDALMDAIRSARPATRRACLPAGGGLPFRDRLRDAPELQERVAADIGWARVILCLYGGVPFADSERWNRDVRHWMAIRAAPTVSNDRRQRAAQVLDALAEADRAARARPGFSVESITVDSPLTPRLLSWLEMGLSSDQVAARCLELAGDQSEGAAARGDALIAWGAVGAEQPGLVRERLAATASPDVAARLRWRLARADFLLRDRLSTDTDEDGLQRLIASAVIEPMEAWATVLRVRHALGVRGALAAASPAPLIYLLSAMAADTADDGHLPAVILDTFGADLVAGKGLDGGTDGAGLVGALCRLPAVAAGVVDGNIWQLDLLAPAHYADLAGALQVIDGLGSDWHLVRSWLVDRLALEAVTLGYGPVAMAMLRDGLTVGSSAAATVAGNIVRLIQRSGVQQAAAEQSVEEPAETPMSAQAYERAVIAGRTPADPALLRAAASSWPSPQDRVRALLRATRLLSGPDQDAALAAAIDQLNAEGGAFTGENAALLRASGSAEAARLLRARHGDLSAIRRPLWDPLWRIESLVPNEADESATRDAARTVPDGMASGPSVGTLAAALTSGADRFFAAAGPEQVAEALLTWALEPGGADRLNALFASPGIMAPWRRQRLLVAAAYLCYTAAARLADWWPDINPGIRQPENLALDNLLSIRGEAAQVLAAPMIDLLTPEFVAAGLGPALLEAARPEDRPRLLHRISGLSGRKSYRRALDRLCQVLAGDTGLSAFERDVLAFQLTSLGGSDAVVVAVPGGLVARISGGPAEYRLDQHLRALRRDRPGWWREHGTEIGRLLATLASASRVAWIGRLMPFLSPAASLGLLDEAAQVGAADGDVAARIGELRLGVHKHSLRSVGWSVLTAAAFCHDARRALDADGYQGAWDSLSVDGGAVAVRRLRAQSGARTFALGASQLGLIAAFLAHGETDAACELLSLGRIEQPLREIDLLRQHSVTRVADLATMLVIELSILDVPGVASLARLFADTDERVRIRARLATTTQQVGGLRRRLVASELGPEVLAALAIALADADRGEPRIATDLMWTGYGIVYDTLEPVRAAAANLTGRPRARLLRALGNVKEEACADLAELLAEADETDADSLLWSLASVWERGIWRLGPQTTARLCWGLNAMRARADSITAAKATRLLGEWASPDIVPELCALALPEGPGWHQPGPVAVGASEALGRLVGRGLPDAEHRLAIETLTAVARRARGPLLTAALAALCRDGEPVEIRVGMVPSLAIVHALLAQVPDTQLNSATREAHQRAAWFVLRPPRLSGDDAIAHSAWLLDAIAERVLEPDDGPDEFTSWRPSMIPRRDDMLGVLAEIATIDPAPVRVLARKHPALSRALARITASDHSWSGRESAARLLLLLGGGDADVIRSLISAMTDNGPVQTITLQHLAWLLNVDDAALEVLAGEADAPRDVAFAVLRMIGELAVKGVLTPAQHRRAVQLVQHIGRRHDAEIPVLLGGSNAAEVIGSLAEQAADVMRELRQLSDLESDEIVPAGFAEVPGTPAVALAVPVAGSVDAPFKYQLGEGYMVGREHVAALEAASRAAAAEHVGLIDVLRATCEIAEA